MLSHRLHYHWHLLIVLLTMSLGSQAQQIVINQAAPAFSLSDQNNLTHRLSDYQGQWVVLYFYPKNDTPGCTTQACAFRDEFKVISALNTQVLGVSVDDTVSHAQFAEKYSLPFPLLADESGEVAEHYGALVSIGPIRFAKRHTIIIDPQGMIRKIYRDVDVDQHSTDVIETITALQSS